MYNFAFAFISWYKGVNAAILLTFILFDYDYICRAASKPN